MTSRQTEQIDIEHPEGGFLRAQLSYAGSPGSWAVLYVHGLGSNRSGVKARAIELACECRDWTFAAFDFRGHGDSSGTMLELRGSGLLNDMDVMARYLLSRGVTRLALFGSSMGGWASAWFALRAPQSVFACALIAPAFQFLHRRWEALTAAEQLEWKQTGRLRVSNQWIDTELGYGMAAELDLFPPDRLAAELARPLLIFHGMNDEVVPHADTIAFVEASVHGRIELRLYKSGDHRLLDLKEEIADAACQFFAQWPDAPPSG